MIYNHCNFYSKILANHVDVDILLPSLKDNDVYLSKTLNDVYKPRLYPVIYLLHGAFDDHSMWTRHTRVEDYAEKADIALVMPSGQNGFYTNAKYGLRYFDFITEELPLLMQTYFPVSNKRSDTFIAGASMGGYGAAKCALRCPNHYKAFADFSGAVNPIELKPKMERDGFDFFRYDLIWGDINNIANSDDDLFKLVADLKESPEKPDAFIYCGTDDHNNHQMNYDFYQLLLGNSFNAAFMDGHGNHDWDYWDQCIKDFIGNISKNHK